MSAPAIRIPLLPVLALLGTAALALAMLAPFGTDKLPAAGRLLFFAALVLASVWQIRLWFRRVPPLLPASRAALPILFVGGMALLAALLPIEFGALARLSGLQPGLPWGLLLAALIVAALAITAVIMAVRWLAGRNAPPVDQAV